MKCGSAVFQRGNGVYQRGLSLNHRFVQAVVLQGLRPPQGFRQGGGAAAQIAEIQILSNALQRVAARNALSQSLTATAAFNCSKVGSVL